MHRASLSLLFSIPLLPSPSPVSTPPPPPLLHTTARCTSRRRASCELHTARHRRRASRHQRQSHQRPCHNIVAISLFSVAPLWDTMSCV
ncbi:hypothetical protein RIF29_29349 [Crotalaria pallida]|uniref:Secreted protein n=1 Tax=Crotalaria pallida TaxID=3830 RepID=A0AAN9EEP2_CROPI